MISVPHQRGPWLGSPLLPTQYAQQDFALPQNQRATTALPFGMAPVLFRCPNQGIVTAWLADDAGNGDDTYESVTCTACRQLHFINPKSGKLLGSEDE